TVPVSELVALIGEPGEESPSDGGAAGRPDGGGAGAKPAKSARREQATQPSPGRDRPESMPPAPPAEAADEADRTGTERRPAAPRPTPAPAPTPNGGRQPGERIKASPLARRIAAERGIDLGAIAGSGPEGRVVARDLEGAATEARAPAGAPAAAPPARGPAGPPFTDVPLTQIRKTIARRLAQSIGPIPTFYLTTEIDMERVAEAREALTGEKVSLNDIVLKAVAMALRQHPGCNAWWQDDRIRYWNEIHVSMAVAVEDGLITPVVRHTDLKSLREIAAETRDLAARARERRLKPEEYTGGTFSVSNLGMLDIDEFTAVINPPETGILAVGRMVQRPVAHEGQIALRRRMRVTMSCDHRVIDGATGAQFLKTLKAMLENPLALVY
ncbi:MAG TPA: dihydrolipoamide acetyltransferase family protein, partial [Gemmatimonadales bacterium]